MRAVSWLALAALLPTTLAGQDIEIASRLSGIRLPDSYYTLVRERPGLFEITRGWATRNPLAREGQSITVAGALPLAVVHALFSDSPTPAFSAAEIQAMLFDGPSTFGTIAEFYSEASGGRFTIAGQALPWVRTAFTREAVVGDNFGLSSDTVALYLVDALTRADSTTDFTQFDNDGPDNKPNSGDDDGFVDAVAFHFVEISASCGGDGIWPHRSSITGRTGGPFVTTDSAANGGTILIDDYIIQSAVTCDGTEIARSSTIAHELGHVLNLPDYYDSTEGILPEQRRWVMGCWSLMAAGAWGCGQVDRNSVDRPTHMGPWEKSLLGWLDSVETVGPAFLQDYTLRPVLGSRHVLKVPMRGEQEFLLVEYRVQEGFDTGLPATGVMIYHIEPGLPLRPCQTCPKVYPVSVLEADGNHALIKLAAEGGDRGAAGDAFVQGDRLTNGSSPSVRLSNGDLSPVTIHAFAVTDSTATLTITTRSIPASALLERYLLTGATDLTAEQEAFLDAVGNRNGVYDLGDLRAYLLDNPAN